MLVVGAEGEGLRQRTKTFCDALVRIPGGQKGLESLNAGVATAVALSEVFRGREPAPSTAATNRSPTASFARISHRTPPPEQYRRPMEKVFGKRSARAVLLTRPESVTRLLLAGKEPYHRDMVKLARTRGIEPEWLEWPAFRREGGVSDDDKHQGVVALTTRRPLLTEADLGALRDASVVLALDQISDPQNLGTILRNAAFFGVDAVLLLKNRAAEISPLVARVAVGGADLVTTYRITNLARSLEILQGMGFWVYGLDERGEAHAGPDEVRRQDRARRRRRGRGSAPAHQDLLRRAGQDPRRSEGPREPQRRSRHRGRALRGLPRPRTSRANASS